MINKCQFLEFAISKFTKFGSKKFTLDELAREMGISKKTIYKNFSGKEAIVNESLILLLEKIEIDINKCIEKENSNPILAVIGIYRVGLDYLKTFSPSFLYGLQKYYPKANREFSNFRKKTVNKTVYNLLLEAQNNGIIRKNVNINLTCKLYLNRIETILFSSNSLFDEYATEVLLEHLIINNIRGITTEKYAEENLISLPNF